MYECTTAGTSVGTEPVWETTVGNTNADGTAEWTCRILEATETPIDVGAPGNVTSLTPTAGDTKVDFAEEHRFSEIHINLHQFILKIPGCVFLARGDKTD